MVLPNLCFESFLIKAPKERGKAKLSTPRNKEIIDVSKLQKLIRMFFIRKQFMKKSLNIFFQEYNLK